MRVKTIAVIGASDEETAHLRLLIRQATPKLTQRWRWGSEVEADLIVVDTGNFTGQMGRTRATAGGVRCAIVSDSERHQDPEVLVLHRPLRIANVIEVLNKAAEGEVEKTEVKHQGDDFYVEGDDAPTTGAIATDDVPRRTARPREKVAVGLDELIRGDPLKEPPPDEALLADLYERSFVAYQRALALTPDDPQVLNDTALMLQYHLEREHDQVETMYRRSIALSEERLADPGLSPGDRERFETTLRDATGNLKLLLESPQPENAASGVAQAAG